MPSHSCSSAPDHRLAGDPVDTLTGAVFDRKLEFRLTGPLELWWYRHYDSSHNHRRFAFGWGHTHDFDRLLRFDGEVITFEAPVGRAFVFPRPERDGDEIARHGFVLRRLSEKLYEVLQRGEPSMEFAFRQLQEPARLRRLFQGPHQILFHYDAAHHLERIVDSTGRSIVVVEEADGRLISLTLEASRGGSRMLLLAYKYDQRGNLIATKNQFGHGYLFTYDDANRMLMRRGRKGFKFRFAYDDFGRCIKATGDDELYGVTLNYKVPKRVTKVTRADGGEWTYCFDAAGGLTEIRDPLGGVQKFLHDETGQVAMEMDSNNNPTRIAYDAAGAAVAKISPLGHRIALPEDPNAPDPLGHRVAANPAEYEYGRMVNIRTITLPSREQVRSLPLSSEARSLVSVRPDQEQYPVPARTFDVRPLGVLWWPEPERGWIFNDFGKLIEQRDEFGRARRWTYDASGNIAHHMDFDGGRWSYDYGSWHLLRGLTDPLGAEVRYSYTTNGEIASCVDAGGTLSEYRYDSKDHLVEVKRHGVVRDTYIRDAVGNLVAKHGGDGGELLRIDIGPGNLPIKRTLASGDEHAFRYDKSGRHVEATTKKDRVEFAYGGLGNLVLEKRNGLGVEHRRFRAWRKPGESVFFERFLVRYEWRNDNTLVITDPGGKSHKIRFGGNGLIERHLSNGSEETSQYDNLGRCLFKCAQRRSGQVWSRRYHWSGEGELQRVEDNTRGGVRHEYDAAHRLRRRFIRGRVEDYEMDLAGNLIQQPGLSQVMYQSGNRLGAIDGLAISYNDRNHVEARETEAGSARYSYDSRDQLVRVDGLKASWTADYDAFNRRTRKTFAGQTTEYYWNGDQLIAEVAADGCLRLYIYADPLALTPLLFLDYDSVTAPLDSCRRYVVFADQIGTPCSMEDDSGAEVWRASIDPFGHAEVAPGVKIQCNLRFPGHYLDPELGLHYNRFRYYDPRLGRYLQSDPWGIAGGYNLYAYRSNPLLEVDVRGLGEENKKLGKPCPDEEGTEPGRPALSAEGEAALGENIAQARQNQIAAEEAAVGKGKKAVAIAGEPLTSDKDPYISGSKPVPGFEDVDPHDTRAVFDPNGAKAAADPDGSKGTNPFPPAPGCVDNGDPGSYHAGHAEIKAAADQPGEPIGVSKPMCDNCQNAMSQHAQDTGQTIVVSDPDDTHVFHPNGHQETIPNSSIDN